MDTHNEIKTLIIEDSVDNREVLKIILSQHCPEVMIAGEAGDVEKGYELILENDPQLVFLDIQLKNHTSFDLLDRLLKNNSIGFEIIFITAHGSFEYATRAIAYSALDFITKPIDSKKLVNAVNKAKSRLTADQYGDQIRMLLENLSTPQSQVNRIAIHLTKGVIEFIPVEEIMYLEADRTITYVFLTDSRKLNAMRNLGHYSKLLVSDHPFYPISNKVVVNLDYVMRYTHNTLTVTLINGEKVQASRRGGQEFRRFLNNQEGMHGKLNEKWWQRLFGS